MEPTPEEEEKREQLRAQARAVFPPNPPHSQDLTAFHAARQKRREALRQQRQRQPATDYRLVEFRNLFGDCTALLLPFVRVIDYTLGPLMYVQWFMIRARQPTDPLLNVVEVVYRRIEEGAADESVLAQEAEKAGAKTVEEKRAWVVKAVKESRFMQCHLASFVFYYECALRYMAKKVTSELNFSC